MYRVIVYDRNGKVLTRSELWDRQGAVCLAQEWRGMADAGWRVVVVFGHRERVVPTL